MRPKTPVQLSTVQHRSQDLPTLNDPNQGAHS
jgi:hypothetical protein